MQALFALLLLAPLPLQADEAQDVASRIDRVTLYQGQALVERMFTVTAAQPGPRAVRIGPMPVSARESSFQTRIGSGPVVVQGLSLQLRSGELDSGQRGVLEERLRVVARAIRDLDPGLKALETRKELVSSMLTAAQKGGLDVSVPGGIADFATQLSAETRSIEAERIQSERDRAVLEAEKRDLETQLGGRRGAQPYRQVRVNLFFERAGTAEMRVHYLVDGASWRPLYDVRLDPDLTRVDVGLVGEVRQASGEDWDSCEMLLSTARPHVGLDPPALPQRYVLVPQSMDKNKSQKLAALGYVDGDNGIDGSTMRRARFAADEEADNLTVAAPMATVQDYGISQQYRIPERVSLAGNGQPETHALVQVPLELLPERYVVPSLSSEAYLRAKVTSSADAPLLPGTARIYLGPDFLGESSFPMLRKGDSTTLNLGIDPNLTVDYVSVRDERDDPGFLASTVHHYRAWELKLDLSSSAKQPIQVLVEEALPISRDDRIKIEPRGMRPTAESGDQDLKDREERGIWRWRVKLDPGGKTAIRWGYTASYDEDLRPAYGQDG